MPLYDQTLAQSFQSFLAIIPIWQAMGAYSTLVTPYYLPYISLIWPYIGYRLPYLFSKKLGNMIACALMCVNCALIAPVVRYCALIAPRCALMCVNRSLVCVNVR